MLPPTLTRFPTRRILRRISDMKNSKGITLVLCLLLVTIFVTAASAQETTAGLQGVARDAQGAVVPKVTVEVSSPSLIGVKKVETDSSGYYRLANLPPGEYSIKTSAPNFKTTRIGGLKLSAGSLPTIDLKL